MYFSLYIQYMYVKVHVFISPKYLFYMDSSPWNEHGMESILDLVNFLIKFHSMWIPCTSSYGFHGTVHMDSMEQSIWIPCTSPYGFHSQSPYFSHFSRV